MRRPNIRLVVADDRAANAVGCGSPRADAPVRLHDPRELHSVHDDPAYAADPARLRVELDRLGAELGDTVPGDRISHHQTTTKESP